MLTSTYIMWACNFEMNPATKSILWQWITFNVMPLSMKALGLLHHQVSLLLINKDTQFTKWTSLRFFTNLRRLELEAKFTPIKTQRYDIFWRSTYMYTYVHTQTAVCVLTVFIEKMRETGEMSAMQQRTEQLLFSVWMSCGFYHFQN